MRNTVCRKIIIQLLRWLDRLVCDDAERRFRQRASAREPLTPDEFADQFFSKHPYPWIPKIVAHVAQTQFNIPSLLPEDNLARGFPDIDFEEFARDVLEELNLPAREFDFAALDGTIANLVERLTQYMEHARNSRTT